MPTTGLAPARTRADVPKRELKKAEESVNNHLVCFGDLVKDRASATHALSCGVPDRNSNETKHLGEALEMIDVWQARCFGRSSV